MSERDKVREALAQLHCKHEKIKRMIVGTYCYIEKNIPFCLACLPNRNIKITEIGTPQGQNHFYSEEWDRINKATEGMKTKIIEQRKQKEQKKRHQKIEKTIKGHLDLMRRQREDEI